MVICVTWDCCTCNSTNQENVFLPTRGCIQRKMVIRFDETFCTEKKINTIMVTILKQIIMVIVQTNKNDLKSENVMNALSFNMNFRSNWFQTRPSCLFHNLSKDYCNKEDTYQTSLKTSWPEVHFLLQQDIHIRDTHCKMLNVAILKLEIKRNLTDIAAILCYPYCLPLSKRENVWGKSHLAVTCWTVTGVKTKDEE